jgi:hypothetical protein
MLSGISHHSVMCKASVSGSFDMPMNQQDYSDLQLRERPRRSNRVLARVRRRQLATALTGQYDESMRYAQLASRVRRYVGECVGEYAPCRVRV